MDVNIRKCAKNAVWAEYHNYIVRIDSKPDILMGYKWYKDRYFSQIST